MIAILEHIKIDQSLCSKQVDYSRAVSSKMYVRKCSSNTPHVNILENTFKIKIS